MCHHSEEAWYVSSSNSIDLWFVDVMWYWCCDVQDDDVILHVMWCDMCVVQADGMYNFNTESIVSH